MIGAAVLAAGVLLLLAAAGWSRIPGWASFARPGIARSPLVAFAFAPIHPATWYANGAILLGLFVGVFGAALVFSLASSGLSVVLVGIGVVVVGLAIECARLVARAERWRASVGESVRPRAHPYKPLRGSPIDLLRAEFTDESRWRDVLYVGVNLPLAILEFAVVFSFWAFALWLVTMPVWRDLVPGSTLPGFLGFLGDRSAGVVVLRTAVGFVLLAAAGSLSQVVIGLHRGVVASLLCTSESRALQRQVAELRESRSAVIESEASELHRIERDLHDGAQQRLVALTMDLGRASDRIATDPAAAKELILEGQEQARAALAEIRSLVRGIAPSILLDRGLGAAVASLASARGPVPTSLSSSLEPGLRLPASVERAAYFVVAESLANVAKHSGAARSEVRLLMAPGPRLVVEVWDNGHGGAAIAPGGGLAGLQGRVEGVDGTFSVSSPAGGPTTVRAEIPIPRPQ